MANDYKNNFGLDNTLEGNITTGNSTADRVVGEYAGDVFNAGKKTGGFISNIIDSIVDFFDD